MVAMTMSRVEATLALTKASSKHEDMVDGKSSLEVTVAADPARQKLSVILRAQASFEKVPEADWGEDLKMNLMAKASTIVQSSKKLILDTLNQKTSQA